MRTLHNLGRQLYPFGNRLIGVLGILFCIIGSAGIILSVIELFHGRPNIYHYDESQGGLKIENPLWPSSGKGIWVGLVLIATGFVSILAFREQTRPSYVGFTALSSVSTVLSFYLIITCIIPVRYDTTYSDTTTPDWLLNELILNSLLIAVGGFGIIVGLISTIVGSIFAGFWEDQRSKYPDWYSDDPARLI